jgi:4-hydroxy-3-polyprenylbenzoate decarboxylase
MSAMIDPDQPIAVAWTGASGIQYGFRLVECLLAAGCRVYLMVSPAAQVVAGMETDLRLPGRPAELEAMLSGLYGVAPGRLRVFGRQQWTAPVASGSNPPAAMAVCPCTTGTLGAIAAGLSKDLIDRAADVALKEGRKLILVVRETPFSVIHLENMLRLARAGAVIMPANPGFYFRPTGVEQLVDFMVARVLDHLGVAHTLGARWGAAEAGPDDA